MKFRIAYNSYHKGSYAKPGKLKNYHFITETIEARGVMHAANLSNAHAKELSKTLKTIVQVADIQKLK